MFKDLNVSTKNISVYTPEIMNEATWSLETELHNTIESAVNSIEGSGWAIYNYNKLYVILHTTKTAMAGSYIKTPETYTDPKCGLINIKNEDDDCFKHCTSYRQPKQETMMID